MRCSLILLLLTVISNPASAASGCWFTVFGACPYAEGVYQNADVAEAHKAPKNCLEQVDRYFKTCERAKSARVVVVYGVDGVGAISTTIDRKVQTFNVHTDQNRIPSVSFTGGANGDGRTTRSFPYVTVSSVTRGIYMADSNRQWTSIKFQRIADPNP